MEDRIYYLYRHVRHDKNKPFYIGIGTVSIKSTNSKILSTIYERAYNKKRRNTHWINITNKTDYTVEILFESDNYEFIKQKEIEFIATHGRFDLGLGYLCNMTDGGDGGINPSKETREKISIANRGQNNNMYGKTHTSIVRQKISDAHKGKSKKPLSEELKKIISNVHKGKIVSNDTRKKLSKNGLGKSPKSIKVINTETLEVYNSIGIASTVYEINRHKLRKYLNGENENTTNLIHLSYYIEQNPDFKWEK